MAEAQVRTVKVTISGDSRSLESAVQRAKTALKGFDKKQKETASFASKLAKIMEYRLIRGGISKIIQGLEEGKKAIDAYDKALNGMSASKASSLMKEMAENTTLLQNTLASLFMTVYASLQPAINALVEMLRGLMNAVNQVISALMGRTTYTKAVKGWNSMTEAAKAYKKQIFGFDELNILKAPDGDNKDAASGMFTEEEISKPLQGIANLMQPIIQQLKEAAGIIDWEDIWTKVGKIGAAIALWKVGQGLADFITKISGNPVYEIAIGTTLFIAGVEGLQGAIIDAITNGLTPGNFAAMVLSSGAIILGGALIGKALGDAVLGATFGAFVVGGTMLWAGLKTALQDGISPVSAFLIATGTAILGALFGYLSSVLSAGMGGLIGLLLGLVVAFGIYLYQHWDEVKAKAAEFIQSIKDAAVEFKDFLVNTWNRLKEGTVKAWKETVSSVTKVWQEFKQKAKELLQPVIDLFEKLKSGWDKVKGLLHGSDRGFDFPAFANGGFPSSGDLFIANEAGPELVGSFGNRTGVYNQEQFAGAMAAANQQVVQAVLAIGSQITGAVNSKPVPSVKIGDRDIFNASQRGANLVGNSLIQGGRS